MNKRSFFLACIQTHLARLGPHIPSSTLVEVQAAAWEVPEEVIPVDVAESAHEFYMWTFMNVSQTQAATRQYARHYEGREPPWLTAWQETREEKR